MNVSGTYDHFYRYQEITDILKGYEKAFPQLVRLSSLGKTTEGRDIWAVSLTNTATGDYKDKPAYCIDANIHAGEVTGSMVAMYALDYLLTNFPGDDEVKKILDRYTFYFVPRITPDGSEAYLTTPDKIRSINKLYPYSQPLPGLQAKDMDGDGVIRKMRVKSPYGPWKVSPRDSRVLTRRQPDDVEGVFYHVFTEGELLDEKDEVKDAPIKFGNDFNRNFPFHWMPETTQRGAGNFALQHPETYAMATFIHEHKNIGMIINMHTMGGQYLYPPSFKARKEAFKDDMERYRLLGKIATEESTYPCINIHDEYLPQDGSASTNGAFDDFNHFAMGLVNYTIECWDLHTRAGIDMKYPPDSHTPEEVQEADAIKYLDWVEKELDGEGYLPWTKFDHPQLGEVEIAGFDYKTVIQNCPPKLLLQELEKHTRFFLRTVKALPNISFQNTSVRQIEGSAYRVETSVVNSGFLPTYITHEALKLNIPRELEIVLEGAEDYVEGDKSRKIGQLEGYSSITTGFAHVDYVQRMDNPCEKKVSWVVRAKPGSRLQLTCSSDRTGKISAEVQIPD